MSAHDDRREAARQPFRLAEKIAPAMGDALVPLWRKTVGGGRALVGTAFFAILEHRQLLVTALHNFTENSELMIERAGLEMPINDWIATTSSRDDLWIAEVPAELHAHLATIKLPVVYFDDPVACCVCTGAVLLGFPGGLNEKGPPFSALPISTTFELRPLQTVTALLEPLVYSIDGGSLTTIEGKDLMSRPSIPGMSGGPVFGWLMKSDQLTYFLQGVITSWQGRLGYVVACNAARIPAVLNGVAPPAE